MNSYARYLGEPIILDASDARILEGIEAARRVLAATPKLTTAASYHSPSRYTDQWTRTDGDSWIDYEGATLEELAADALFKGAAWEFEHRHRRLVTRVRDKIGEEAEDDSGLIVTRTAAFYVSNIHSLDDPDDYARRADDGWPPACPVVTGDSAHVRVEAMIAFTEAFPKIKAAYDAWAEAEDADPSLAPTSSSSAWREAAAGKSR